MAARTVNIFDVKSGQIIPVDQVDKTDDEWKKVLTPEQYEVTTRRGTERPFTCDFEKIKTEGIFQCVRCGTDLFVSKTKFESGTGWPSYYEPVSPLNVRTHADMSFGMVRTEVVCARCGAHLGHVFDDLPAGRQATPPPTHKRYCINGVALKFRAM